jgi:Protein of unknown function (DUF2637)
MTATPPGARPRPVRPHKLKQLLNHGGNPMVQPGMLTPLRRIRWATRLTLAFGVTASGIANVLHAEPNPISRTISAWPPLALLLTVELISRVPVHRFWMAFLRLGATGLIAGIAGWISYWHMAAVTEHYGETGSSAFLLPLTVDGLVVVASISLVELNARIRDIETHTTPTVSAQSYEDRPAQPPTSNDIAAPVLSTQDDQTEIIEPVPAQNPPTPNVPAPVRKIAAAPLPADLLAKAREAADNHLEESGRTISRDELRAVLRISNGTTGDVMRALGLTDSRSPAAPAITAVSPLTGKPLLPAS